MTGLLQHAALAALGFAVLIALLAATAYPAARPWLAERAPAARAGALLAWAIAPALLGTALAAVCFLPSALNLAGLASDHCHEHGDHHPHLCLRHPPGLNATSGAWLPLALAAGAILATAVRRRRRAAPAARLLAALEAGARPGPAPDLRLVEADAPLALAAGLQYPRIYISTALAAALPAPQLTAVIAHERAHVHRRDAARQATAVWLASFHLPPVRRWLLRDLALACEQACDEEAARITGDRLGVAEAILAVERLLTGRAAAPNAALACAFDGSNVPARVEALLAVAPASPGRGAGWPLTAGAVLLAALAEPLHHAAETVLGLLGR